MNRCFQGQCTFEEGFQGGFVHVCLAVCSTMVVLVVIIVRDHRAEWERVTFLVKLANLPSPPEANGSLPSSSASPAPSVSCDQRPCFVVLVTALPAAESGAPLVSRRSGTCQAQARVGKQRMPAQAWVLAARESLLDLPDVEGLGLSCWDHWDRRVPVLSLDQQIAVCLLRCFPRCLPW